MSSAVYSLTWRASVLAAAPDRNDTPGSESDTTCSWIPKLSMNAIARSGLQTGVG